MRFELELILPWPPSVNHYKKIGALIRTKSGKLYQRRVDTAETKSFYFQAYIIAKKVMHPEWLKLAQNDNISYQACVYLHPPHTTRYDIDNRLKVLLDGLVKAKVIKDDSQIAKLYIEKREPMQEGHCIVRLKTIS